MSTYKHVVIQIFRILTKKQRRSFIGIAILLVGTAFCAQITPLAIGYLTDSVLTTGNVIFTDVLPVLLLVLAVNLASEGMKVARRLMIEDTATATEKNARQRAIDVVLIHRIFSGHQIIDRNTEIVSNLLKRRSLRDNLSLLPVGKGRLRHSGSLTHFVWGHTFNL